MKRYGISNKEAEDFPYVAVLRDRDDGDAVLFADLQARDLKLAELVRALPHSDDCKSRFCCFCGSVFSMSDICCMPERVPHFCNCPRGELLAMLGETNG